MQIGNLTCFFSVRYVSSDANNAFHNDEKNERGIWRVKMKAHSVEYLTKNYKRVWMCNKVTALSICEPKVQVDYVKRMQCITLCFEQHGKDKWIILTHS